MKAIQIAAFGGPDVLQLVELETPVPAAGQARVRVEAAGVNFIETHIRAGAFPMPLPTRLGGEVVGVVDALGPGVDTVRIGDRVAAPLFMVGAFEGYAEHVVLDAALLVAVPPGLAADTASLLLSQGFTAYHLARLFPAGGNAVFVHAAAGAVGSLLLQLLRRQGPRLIVAGAGAAKHAWLKDLGADVVVDYGVPGWVEAVSAAAPDGLDLVFDAAGAEVSKASLGLLGLGGRQIVYGAPTLATLTLGPPEFSAMSMKSQSLHAFSMMPLLASEGLKPAFDALADLIAKGELEARVGERYPLAEAARAHADLEARRTSGKVVLVP